jgi:hypothetical protein
MIPMRTSTIFKSRWMALLWAAGIIWFAYDFAAPSGDPQGANAEQPTDVTGATITDEEAKTFQQAVNRL